MNMRKSFYALYVAVLPALSLAVTGAEPELKEIMQGLRDDTVSITDGLLTDDLNRVANGATGIAGHARISTEQIQMVASELGTEMAAFKQFDELVHELSLSIASAARENDRERAITDYQRMLNGCFACHAAYKERVGAALSAASDPD